MSSSKDAQILRPLAERVLEISAKRVQSSRRELWRAVNSLRMERPMLNVNGFMWWQEVYPDAATLRCGHIACRETERYLLQCLLHDEIGDDTVIEPWVVIRAVYGAPYINVRDIGDTYWCENAWGLPFRRIMSREEKGAWKFDPVIVDTADSRKLTAPVHTIDEQRTAEYVDAVQSAIGDIMPVIADRGPMIRTYGGSVIHDLAMLRGLEELYYDMYDEPEWLSGVMEFMSGAVTDLHAQAEAAGDLRLINTFNQTMTYCDELPDPTPSEEAVSRKQLWHFYEAQEYTAVSPGMFWEFAAKYHEKMASEYGLAAYGCCEDLTDKIPYLKRIKNLRSIAVTPWADVEKCAEQIGGDYVVSWRPNPANTLCTGCDADFLRGVIRDGLTKCRANGCSVEINLKDVFTIRRDVDALRRWVAVVMEEIQK